MGTLTSTETDRLAAYTVGSTASTGPFPITFPFADNDDIAVYVNGTKISTYGVTQGSAYGTSGNFITLQTGVTNSTVSVVSEASAVRSTTDSLTLTALNGEIDNIYANLQENQFDKTRSMNAPLTDPTTSNMTLPSHTARAGRLLGFNSTTGNPEAGPDIASVSTVTQISADIGTVAGISANVTTVAGISSSVTSAASNSTAISSVAGIASNVTTVAGIAANITAVAGKTTEITDLSTSANITNMATLGATGVVSNIATVAGVSSELAAAGTNATNAAASASAAANSAAAAAASFDTFDDRYLGSKSSEPSVDNDGNALVSGALFFDSAVGSMKVYDGGNWILATSAGAASLLDYEYTATAGQTTFSGSDNNSATLSYSAGNLIVSLNGIILDNGSDYTATSGTSIVLASGAALNDHLAVVAFKSFTVADTVAASTGGTFAGGVTVSSGNLLVGTTDTTLYDNTTGTGTKIGGDGRLDVSRQADTVATFNRTGSSDGEIIRVVSSGTTIGAIGSVSGDIALTSTTNPIRFSINNSEKIRFGSAGQLGVGGANYGTSGQVLTSTGSGAAPSWADLNAGFLANVVNVTSDTTVTASQSGTLFVIKSATAILTLPAPAVGLYFGVVNETTTPTLMRVGGSNSVFANNIVFPLNHLRSVGLGTFVGVSSTKYACDFDPTSAAVVSFFRNGDPNSTTYSETWSIGTNTTAIYIAMHSGVNGNYYTSPAYLNPGVGGASFSEKLITSSIPSTLTIAGDYRQFDGSANIASPPTSSRLTCVGTGVNMYVQRGTGSYYSQGYTQTLTGGTASGGDFNASGGSGSGSSGSDYHSASTVYGGGGGAGSPAGTGGNASTSASSSNIFSSSGVAWAGYSSVYQVKHGGGTGGNHGTTSGGGAAGTKDSNSITMTPYIGKEFHLAGGGSTLVDQAATGLTAARYDVNIGAQFGHALNDLEHISNNKLFSHPPFGRAGAAFGGSGPSEAGCTIIEFKG